jgi:hypothetical protein
MTKHIVVALLLALAGQWQVSQLNGGTGSSSQSSGGVLYGQISAALPATTQIVNVMQAPKALTAQNLSCASTFATCATKPTWTAYDCGSSTTCASPTTIGTCTVASTGTIVTTAQGSLSSTAIASGDYVALEVTGGACVAITAASASLAY